MLRRIFGLTPRAIQIQPGVFEARVSALFENGVQVTDLQKLAERLWELKDHMRSCEHLESHRIRLQVLHQPFPGSRGSSTIYVSGIDRNSPDKWRWDVFVIDRSLTDEETLWMDPDRGDRWGKLQLAKEGVFLIVNTNPVTGSYYNH